MTAKHFSRFLISRLGDPYFSEVVTGGYISHWWVKRLLPYTNPHSCISGIFSIWFAFSVMLSIELISLHKCTRRKMALRTLKWWTSPSWRATTSIVRLLPNEKILLPEDLFHPFRTRPLDYELVVLTKLLGLLLSICREWKAWVWGR
jgi:hypothetical protein